MAKQYIPNVSGLLTESNPVDAPSNTLSEAENIIIDQGGKAQSRHGFNVKEKEYDTDFYDDANAISDFSINGGNASIFEAFGYETEKYIDFYRQPSESINFQASNFLGYRTDSTYGYVFQGIAKNIRLQFLNKSEYYKEYSINSTTVSDAPHASITSPNDKHYYTNVLNISNTDLAVNDLNIPFTFRCVIKKPYQGSSKINILLGLTSDELGEVITDSLKVVFNTETLSVESNTVSGSNIEYIDSNVESLGNTDNFATFYNLIINCKLNSLYNKVVIQYYLRTFDSYDNRVYSSSLITDSRMQFDTYTPINGSAPYTNAKTILNCVSIYDYLSVGDYIKFQSGSAPIGLDSTKYYKIIEISGNDVTIAHPNIQVTAGSVLPSYFSSATNYDICSQFFYQNTNNFINEYYGSSKRNIKSSLTTNGWVLGFTGNTTKIYYDTRSSLLGIFPAYVKFIGNNTEYLPVGLDENTLYQVLFDSTDLISGNIPSKSYIRINATTYATELIPNVPIQMQLFYRVTINQTGYPTKLNIGINRPSRRLKLNTKIKFYGSNLDNLPNGINKFESYKIILNDSEKSGSDYLVQIDVATTGASSGEVFYIYEDEVPVYPLECSPHYTYTSQYTQVLPFLKLIEYKNSLEEKNTIFFVKQNINSYIPNQTGIFKVANDNFKYKYYKIDSYGNIEKYETLKYSLISNVFYTKESLYLQTENGLSEASVDSLTQDANNKFFDFKWLSFPKIKVNHINSDLFTNWLRGGYKFNFKMTFYRETGYTDKPGFIYESEPSSPFLITALTKDSIPEIYLDFVSIYTNDELHSIFNEFTKANGGRKFGIKLYRTEIVPLDQEISTEYYTCYVDIPFEKFLSGTIANIDNSFYKNINWIEEPAGVFYYRLSNNNKTELNIGDVVCIQPLKDQIQDISSDDTLKYSDQFLKYHTTDSDLLIYNKEPVRLRVADKQLRSYFDYVQDPYTDVLSYDEKSDYFYNFESINYLYNLSGISVTSASNYIVVDASISFKSNTDIVYFSNIGTSNLLKEKLYRLQFVNTVGSVSNYSVYDALTNAYVTVSTSSSLTMHPINLPNKKVNLMQFPVYKSVIPITKSFICKLESNDEGIIELPELYTNPNVDAAKHTNNIVPRSSNSIKYKDFWVYSGIEKSLEATMYVIKQPKSFQANLTIDTTAFNSNDNTSFLTIGNFYLYTNEKLPTISSSVTTKDQRYFIDCPVFEYRDMEIKSINAVDTRSSNNIGYSIDTLKNSNLFIEKDVNAQTVSFSGTICTYSSGSSVVLNDRISFITDGTLPSPLLKNKAYYITDILSSTTFKISNSLGGSPITFSVGSGTHYFINQSKLSNVIIQSTIYEQSKLTLQLTSLTDEVNEISIKTYPEYNRRGYYSKYSENGSLDTRALEFDYSVYEMNGPLSNGFINKNFASLGVNSKIYNIPGNKNGQAKFDGRVTFNSTTITQTTVSAPGNTITDIFTITGSYSNLNDCPIKFNVDIGDKIRANVTYYIRDFIAGGNSFRVCATPGADHLDITACPSVVQITIIISDLIFTNDGTNGGLLIVRNTAPTNITSTSNVFDIKSFPAPGFVFIQYKSGTNVNTTLFSYSSIQTASAGSDTFVFKNVKQALGTDVVLSSASATDVAYLYAIQASSIDAIPLYTYSKPPELSKIVINYQSPSNLSNLEYTRDNYIDTSIVAYEPYFTIVKHNKKPQTPVATLSKDTNNKFYGAQAGYARSNVDLLNDYAFLIVKEFNKELKAKNINAYAIKGPGAGEIKFIYPDGKKIEIRNDYGEHEFLPNIKNNITNVADTRSYVSLAERYNNEYIEKHLIKWSRRNIPEITTGELYAALGKNDKLIIGMAANTDDLFIFKEDGIWRCMDNGDSNGFDLPIVSNFLFSNTFICQASGSIQEVNDEIIFLSQYGFASISGGGIQLIDGAINRDILTLLAITPKERINSFVNKSKSLYYCSLINEVEPSLSIKSGTYVFNTKTRQWTFMDEELLTGIEDFDGKSISVYRQRPIKGKLLNRVETEDGTKPTFSFDSNVYDSANKLQRFEENQPLDMYYIIREQHTNNIKNNAEDQYDYVSETRYEGYVEYYIKKSDSNEFYIKTESIRANTIFRNKFRTSVEHALVSNYSDNPPIGTILPIVDSFVSLFANRSVYLRRNEQESSLYHIKLKKTGFENLNMLVYFEFVDTPPDWFTSMSLGYFNTTGTATYQIVSGIPVKITFNPESNNSPDTNKLFQEYMVHTETNNKGALMSFKTDSRSNFTIDRRFIYDAAATKRNVFRTYIPTNAARGRYLIRQIKHDLPLENLIITGQTIVMKDSASTRIQKDKDNE